MFSHYLKIAFRSLLRKKGYSFINIAGLAVGMACCLAIFQYVSFEYSIDQFHENKHDLYSVIMAVSSVQAREIQLQKIHNKHFPS